MRRRHEGMQVKWVTVHTICIFAYQRDRCVWLAGCWKRSSSSTMAPKSPRCRMHRPMAWFSALQAVTKALVTPSPQLV